MSGTAPTVEQASLLARLKATDTASSELPVHSGAGVRVGTLAPLTHKRGRDPGVLADLYRWRRANMTSFLTVFEPSLEKTDGYVNRFSLPDPARILFLVLAADRSRVGHIGVCNVGPSEAEIDNVLRGEKVREPGFMRLAMRALSAWAFKDLGVERLYLNVLADNERAISSYEKAGFAAVGRESLIRQDFEGGYKLVPPAPGYDGPLSAELVRMELRAPTPQTRH